MTPQEKQHAKDLLANATQGIWHFENVNWIGPALFSVYSGSAPNDRGREIMSNIEPDSKGYDNMEFLMDARAFLPKALAHIEGLENDVAELKAGRKASSLPQLTAADIAKTKDLTANATGGNWSWENDDQIAKGVRTVYAGRDPRMHGLNLFGRFYVANDKDLDFICAAPALVPAALKAIETLEREVKRLSTPSAPKPRGSGAPKP